MNNILEKWVDESSQRFLDKSFSVTMCAGENEASSSVNLDCRDYVGTITFWPPSTVEIQFNSCLTGEVVHLSTESFDSVDMLSSRVFSALEGIGVSI